MPLGPDYKPPEEDTMFEALCDKIDESVRRWAINDKSGVLVVELDDLPGNRLQKRVKDAYTAVGWKYIEYGAGENPYIKLCTQSPHTGWSKS